MAIAKMKRVFLIGPVEEREKAMELLQDVGVVHVEPAAKISGELEKRNAALQQEVRRVHQVYEEMNRFEAGEAKTHAAVPDDQMVSYCESRLFELQEVQNRKQSLQKLVSELNTWGNFEPEKIQELEREGIYVQRFRIEGRLPPDFHAPEDAYMEVVSEKPAYSFFTIRIGGTVDIPNAIHLRLPEMGLARALDELSALREEEARLVDECKDAKSSIGALKEQYNIVLNEANYIEHLGTLYSEEHLFGLQGWVPADLEDGLMKGIGASKLPLMVTTRDPLEDETPPTLFRNNWFIRRIEPLLNLYGLPSYKSLDPSYFFAPFMVLFFGICLGDAGYGLVFLLASSWIKKKWGHLSKEMPLVMKLCQAFSVSAIVIGLLTGSVFGYSFTNREWVLVDLDIDVGNPMILFYASLGLGVLHLSFSYLLGMLEAQSRNDMLQKLGLMLVLWGGAFLISRNIWFLDPASRFNEPFNYAGWGLLLAGVILTFLSASDSKKWVVRIGLGFWGVYGLTGLVGDLLSYARLFGLGIATTAIAAVMNQLAGMVYNAAGPIIGAVFAVLLLILGHTFNLALSILGSTVHSARLHFVEAFRSFFRGGGIQYKPFKVERG
ncbi:MAG TPA: V-type ATPase 116kDa subunit family protein [Syntrophorhabdaceae bacterium]|nr:V-type ATPase 116kDa subunit family protein [Syntrophorhabdaceae bacterium]HQM80590.1 V-type ATPase 116kDa subunit family protein [Syntrophorhabdaceae bacterium]